MPDSPTRPAEQSSSPKKGGDAAGVKHGRRADDGTGERPKPVSSGWGEDSQVKKPLYDQPEQSSDVPVAASELQEPDENVTPSADQAALGPEQEEELIREVAAAPVEYKSVMPKLADLELAGAPATAKWANMAHSAADAHGDVDLSCLTSVLCAQLDDDDEPWVPDIMLVQLTSELIDAQTAGVDDDVADDGPSTATDQINRANVSGSPLMSQPSQSSLKLSQSAGSPTDQGTAGGDMGVSAAGRRRGRV
jgi:hypothetical protein